MPRKRGLSGEKGPAGQYVPKGGIIEYELDKSSCINDWAKSLLLLYNGRKISNPLFVNNSETAAKQLVVELLAAAGFTVVKSDSNKKAIFWYGLEDWGMEKYSHVYSAAEVDPTKFHIYDPNIHVDKLPVVVRKTEGENFEIVPTNDAITIFALKDSKVLGLMQDQFYQCALQLKTMCDGLIQNCTDAMQASEDAEKIELFNRIEKNADATRIQEIYKDATFRKGIFEGTTIKGDSHLWLTFLDLVEAMMNTINQKNARMATSNASQQAMVTAAIMSHLEKEKRQKMGRTWLQRKKFMEDWNSLFGQRDLRARWVELISVIIPEAMNKPMEECIRIIEHAIATKLEPRQNAGKFADKLTKRFVRIPSNSIVDQLEPFLYESMDQENRQPIQNKVATHIEIMEKTVRELLAQLKFTRELHNNLQKSSRKWAGLLQQVEAAHQLRMPQVEFDNPSRFQEIDDDDDDIFGTSSDAADGAGSSRKGKEPAEPQP